MKHIAGLFLFIGICSLGSDNLMYSMAFIVAGFSMFFLAYFIAYIDLRKEQERESTGHNHNA
nr:MAG TPA: Phosphoinositide-interacting protein family [Bacteriophage sp.]